MIFFRATPSAAGEAANYIMFGREVKLPDLLAYGNKMEEPQLHPDYAVDQQALLKDVHD